MNDLPGLNSLFRDSLLTQVVEARRPGLLVLDYDGVLAPFRVERSQAKPYPGVVRLLSRIPRQGACRFVIVSGRPAAEVAGLLGVSPPSEIWGCHGGERLIPGQLPAMAEMSAPRQSALVLAEQMAGRLLPVGALERKPFSLAVHVRGLDALVGRALLERVSGNWAGIAQSAGFEVHAFDGGLELRPPELNKGLTVRTLRRENPGAVMVCLGDDLTDEDAFTALDESGIGVLVRDRPRPTAARYRIRPLGDLLVFLRGWSDCAAAFANDRHPAKDALVSGKEGV